MSYFSKKENSEMAQFNITELLHHIKEIKSSLKPGEELPEWVEAKLTLATDYLSVIAHYIDGAKEAGVPLAKSDVDKINDLEKSLKLLKNTIDYSAPGMGKLSSADFKAKQKADAENIKATTGVKGGQVSQAPAMSGVAVKRQIGTTTSGKPVHSHFDNPAHSALTQADHGEAAQMHRSLRDEIRPLVDSGHANPALMEHHQNQMMAHSKAQAEMRAMGRK